MITHTHTPTYLHMECNIVHTPLSVLCVTHYLRACINEIELHRSLMITRNGGLTGSCTSSLNGCLEHHRRRKGMSTKREDGSACNFK